MSELRWAIYVRDMIECCDEDVAWDIISRDIPELMPLLRALLDEAEGEDSPDGT